MVAGESYRQLSIATPTMAQDLQSLTPLQLSQTRMVTGRRMVRTTCKLESEYSRHGTGDSGNYSGGMEYQRGKRI